MKRRKTTLTQSRTREQESIYWMEHLHARLACRERRQTRRVQRRRPRPYVKTVWQVCVCVYVCLCVCVCLSACICVCLCEYVFGCMYVYVYVYVCMCVYEFVCVYASERERESFQPPTPKT